MASPSKPTPKFPQPLLRPARESDIPAITTLFLTSFRQFTFFSFLYSPLKNNPEYTHDTVWWWRKRLLMGILDPRTSIVVTELDVGRLKAGNEEGRRGEDEESWDALKWAEENGLATTTGSNVNPGMAVVGFAIWVVKEGEGEAIHTNKNMKTQSWWEWMRLQSINFEMYIWSKISIRKDQQPSRVAAFKRAVDDARQYYQQPTLYLDITTVDFRCQRSGVGTSLIRWGLEKAREMGLPVMTEASPQGLGLYLKEGFRRVGWFTAKDDGGEGEEQRLPVLRVEC